MVTVKAIAEQAGVSIGTVSRVLNNHHNVDAQLRNRVLEAATQLGYERRRKHIARHLHPRTLVEVVFLFHPYNYVHPAPLDPFWSHIFHGIESEVHRRHLRFTYRSLTGSNQEGVEALCEELAGTDACGMLLVGPASLALVQALQRAGGPIVLVDNRLPHYAIDAVLSDNFEGARTAVAHLIAAGHRDIALIGGPTTWQPGPVNTIYTIEQRALGYRVALAEAGVPRDERLYEATVLTVDGGYQAATRLIERGVHFTGLFCSNDPAAIGAIKALTEHGRRVPDDVSVVGFDDIDMAQHVTPTLTTVRVDKEMMGRLAVQRLVDRANDPTLANVTLMLNVDFVVRGTVAPPK